MKMMRLTGLALLALLVMCGARNTSAAFIRPDLPAVAQRLAILFGDWKDVDQQPEPGCVLIWKDAEQQTVRVPNGKGANSGYREEKRLMPKDTGWVLEIYGPFDASQTQKDWGAFDDGKGKAECVHNAGGKGQDYGLVLRYGKSVGQRVRDTFKALPTGILSDSADNAGAWHAQHDIAGGKLRIVYFGKPWSQGKPLVDDESGLPVEIVAGCMVTREFPAHAAAYNRVMREKTKQTSSNQQENKK